MKRNTLAGLLCAVARAANDYGKWAAEVAQSAGVPFLDLNEVIARRYEALGEEEVKPLVYGDHTHTSPEGARISAACVVDTLKQLTSALGRFLRSSESKP